MPARQDLLQLDTRIAFDSDTINAPNLTSRFGEKDLQTLGGWAYDGYYSDLLSRSHWERRMTAAMELAIQLQKLKNFPWPGCSSVAFPLITIGALQFSANSYANIIQGQDVVNYRVVGEDKTGALTKRAERVGRHMSWQCLEQDQAWEEQHDKLLINLSVVGTAFIKSFLCPKLKAPVGEFVSAQDLVVNYWAKSIEDAQRKTQRIALSRNEIYGRVIRETFRDVRGQEWYNSLPGLPEGRGEEERRTGLSPVQTDGHTPYPFLEQHTYLDLDHDGYLEPYTVTFEERSKCVTRLVARVWGEDAVERSDAKEIVSIKAAEYYTKYSFIPNPDCGFYDLGFGILLGPLNESVSSIINQMIDNGTLHNLSGGFMGRGMTVRGGVYTMQPFEFRRVDLTGDDIRKQLVMFEPHAPPDILFKLLELLISYSDRIAGTTETMVGENPGQNTPASTFQGLQERGLNIYAWIFKRIWRAMKGEMKLRYELNKRSLPSARYYGQQNALVMREDYNGDPDQIAPVADPNLPSNSMRMAVAMFLADRSKVVPGYDHDAPERNLLRAMRIANADQFYLGVERAKPLPNPKMQQEQAKLMGIQAKIQADKIKWANELMEAKRLNDAKVMQLRAQAYSLVKGAQNDDVKNKLESLELVMNVLQQFSENLTNQIGALTDGTGDKSANGGGMGGVAPASDDASLAGDAPPAAGIPQGAPSNGAGGAGADASSSQ